MVEKGLEVMKNVENLSFKETCASSTMTYVFTKKTSKTGQNGKTLI